MHSAKPEMETVRCVHCGYERGGLPPDSVCPECGRVWAQGLSKRLQRYRLHMRWYGIASAVLLLPVVMVPINLIWAYWVYRLPATDPKWPHWIQTGDYPVIDATFKPMFAYVCYLGWLWLPIMGWAIWLSVFGWRLHARAIQNLRVSAHLVLLWAPFVVLVVSLWALFKWGVMSD